jgi:serine/threonine protein kinase
MANLCDHCGADNLEIDVHCVKCGKPLVSTGVHRMIGSVVLDQYEIIDVLGQGGMSVVYKARHRLTEQEVALKVLPRELAAHSQVKSRFLEEARALAALDHTNIVHLYNFGEADGCLVLAMQFVRGKTFEELILDSDRLDWRTAVGVCVDVLKALEYAHTEGIVHRDMKPSNILVRADNGAATVMDFGIAKMTKSTRLTATGQTMGTVRYMSPEQVRGKEVDVRTDIYSLGATLFEAVVGDTPFDGETHFEIMTKHLNEPPPTPSEMGAELPASLERVILKTLMKRREERFATAFLFRKALEAVLAGEEPVLERAESEQAPSRAESAPAPAPPVITARPDQATSQLAHAPTGIASSLEPVIHDENTDVVLVRSSRGPVLWISLAVMVLAAGFVVFLGTRGGADPPKQAAAGAFDAAVPAGPPEPFLVDGMHVVVDQPYEADKMRILSVTERDPEPVAEAVRASREQFLALLQKQGGGEGVVAQYVNVVVVPDTIICDRRLYESAESYDGCEKRESHYRAHERTLYVADNDRLLQVNLPSEVALQMCLDSASADCAEAFKEFERELLARRKKPKKNRRR